MSRRMKTKIAHIQGALGVWLEHEGVQGWMVVPSAITFPWSRTSGWENSSRCQWWSSLFWIRRVTPEELHSLSKTTKLLLLDSLLQEVCIESGSDGSLALSSLGLSVFFGQSQTTFFWKANESHLFQWIDICTWEIEWLLSERHVLCVLCMLSRHQSCRSSRQCHASGQSVNWLSKTTKLLLLEYYYKR